MSVVAAGACAPERAPVDPAVPDTTPPVITARAERIDDSTVVVRGTVTDAESRVVGVFGWINEYLGRERMDTARVTPGRRVAFEIRYPPRAQAVQLDLRIEAIDEAGNWASTGLAWTFAPEPIVTFESLTAGDTLGDPGIEARVVAYGAGTRARVRLTLDVGTSTERLLPVDTARVVTQWPVSDRARVFVVPVDLTAVPEGAHTLTLRVVDDAGRDAASTLAFVRHVPEIRYGLLALPTLGDSAAALDVRDGGDVVGRARDAAGVWRAVLWRDGTVRRLVTPDTVPSSAVAINAAGEIAGHLGPAERDNCTDPARWSGASAAPVLAPGSAERCWDGLTVDMNDRGSILLAVGGAGRPVLWRRDGTLTPLTPSPMTVGLVLDERDVAYGLTLVDSYWSYATTWGPTETRVACPDEIAHLPPRGSSCRPTAASDAGELLAWVGGGAGRPMLRQPDGTWIDLEAHLGTRATPAMNRLGTLVSRHAATGALFVGRVGEMRRLVLPEGDWVVERVQAISPGGWIVGSARSRSTGAARPVLLSPGG